MILHRHNSFSTNQTFVYSAFKLSVYVSTSLDLFYYFAIWTSQPTSEVHILVNLLRLILNVRDIILLSFYIQVFLRQFCMSSWLLNLGFSLGFKKESVSPQLEVRNGQNKTPCFSFKLLMLISGWDKARVRLWLKAENCQFRDKNSVMQKRRRFFVKYGKVNGWRRDNQNLVTRVPFTFDSWVLSFWRPTENDMAKIGEKQRR